MHAPGLNGDSTRSSLLVRLKDAGDQTAWREFERTYRDLLFAFCIRSGLQHFDAEDVIQRVLANMVKTLPGFVYDRSRGRFRDYLLRSLLNAIADWFRDPNRRNQRLDTTLAAALTAGSESDSATSTDHSVWEEEWLAHHTRRAFAAIRGTVDSKSIQIFERSLEGASVANLAVEFEMTEDGIRKVRQRIRARMEELISEQIREEDEADE